MLALAHAAPQLLTGDGLEPLPRDTRPLEYHISATPDLGSGRFTARAELSFEVLKPTRQVVVNSLELDITAARLKDGAAAKIVKDDARQRVIFELEKPLERGTHALVVEYSGPINNNAAGVFRVKYPTSQGVEKEMLFTHLCCIGTARRFAPLWDQPDLKAVFDIELTVSKGLTAISNMPIAHRADAEAGRERVQFAPTPKMSTYLLFFAVGDFDRITREVDGTELGVVLQKGRAEKGRFALNATADALDYYNHYFGVPYPLPKLDSVGMPGAGNFGAMENWGAIFYFEPFIMLDPALSTEGDAQTVYEVVTHEVAHQWFGNLVTMEWWDDLWLNEGFASWMAGKMGDRVHPEWKVWLHAADPRESAIRLDASATTHPIIRKVKTLEEAELAFDEITYEKGAAVIRMIEGWAGDNAFRSAIRAHIRNHAYGNAVTADLWKELEKTSSRPITAIARDFTEQSGVPLIEVLSTKCAPGSSTTTLIVRQSRFGLDASSRAARLWNVPLIAGVPGSRDLAHRVVRGTKPTRIDVPGCGPVKVNFGDSGYYRTQYDAASLAALQASFMKLNVADQLGLLKDTRSLAEGDYLSLATYFDIADSLPPQADPLLFVDYARTAQHIDSLYEGQPARAQFRAFAQKRFGAVLERVGWTARPGEPSNTAMLRDTLIETLAQLGDEATLTEARRRFESAARDPSLLPGAVRKAIVEAVAAGADAATFEDFTRRAAQATDSAEQRLYLMALADANDSEIATKAMELSLTDAVPHQLFESLLQGVAKRHSTLAFRFAAQRYDDIAARAGSYAGMFMASLADNGLEAAFAEEFDRFATTKLGADVRESSERAKALILYHDRLRRRALVQLDGWLKQRTPQ
jgi:aminopeptidase N